MKSVAHSASPATYDELIGAPQCRQRPRKATQETMGMRSAAPNVASQFWQCDRPFSECPAGTRIDTTFTNEPTTAPNTPMKMTKPSMVLSVCLEISRG